MKFASSTLAQGSPARISGTLPEGTYLACVVLNQAVSYVAGQVYTGASVQCTSVQAGADGVLKPVTIWQRPAIGDYDVLILVSAQDSTIVAGDNLGVAAGLSVASLVPGPGGLAVGGAVLALMLGVLAIPKGSASRRRMP